MKLFHLFTVAASQSCGGTVNYGGIIESPGFASGGYSNSLNCVWNIDLPSSVSSFRVFASSFQLEYQDNCDYDSLQIIDAYGSEQNFCGPSYRRRRQADEKSAKNELGIRRANASPSGFPSEGVTVSGRTGTISFITDGSQTFSGFRIEIVPDNCGRPIYGYDIIESPGFSNGAYYNGLSCTWNIDLSASTNSAFRVVPSAFQLEIQDNCNYDTVQVIDGQGSEQNFCGPSYRRRRETEEKSVNELSIRRTNASPSGFPSAVNFMGTTGSISFFTDGSQTFSGFQLEVIPFDCGRTISGSDTILSPGFASGSSYYDGLSCSWNIDLPPSVYEFELVASTFELESHDSCDFDSLQIIDAQGNEQNFCGYSSRRRRQADEKLEKNELGIRRANAVSSGFPSGGVKLNGRTGTVSFLTDGSSVHAGFRLEVLPISCGGTVYEYGVIESPGHSTGSYYDNLSCQWNIQLSDSVPAFIIQPVSPFSLEGGDSCPYDTVQIIDNQGFEQNFCGTSSRRRRDADKESNGLAAKRANASSAGFPSDGVTVIGNTGTLSFMTDGSQTYPGFQLEVVPLASIPCGGIIGDGDIIRSPGFASGAYYNDLNCVWEVQLSESVPAFEISASSFNLQSCPDCSCDILRVEDNEGNEHSFCGDSGLQTLAINGNSARITFTTDDITVSSGFEMELAPLDAPLSYTPAAAWQELDAAYNSLFEAIFNSYEQMPNIPSIKKANRLRDFYQKISNFSSRSSDSCSNYAGSGDPADFIVPSYDEQDLCGSLNTFFMSAKSYHNAFVCMDGVDLTANNRWAAHKMTRLIQRQRHILFTRKLRRLNCF